MCGRAIFRTKVSTDFPPPDEGWRIFFLCSWCVIIARIPMSNRKIPTKPAALRSFQDPAVKHRKICSLLTRPLGLLGWETLEPVLLAALTTRDPLLLIGKHGTGKSFLLERLAQALGLVYRFYNASLINYDDLVGIPVPDETRSSLRYITTPTAIWDAEVVFVDELNRTRPDLQNKLFPIIHERRVQGVELEKLALPLGGDESGNER